MEVLGCSQRPLPRGPRSEGGQDPSLELRNPSHLRLVRLEWGRMHWRMAPEKKDEEDDRLASIQDCPHSLAMALARKWSPKAPRCWTPLPPGTGATVSSTPVSPWGSDYYRETGRMMPEDGLEEVAGHDAILFGAVGAPEHSRPHHPARSDPAHPTEVRPGDLPAPLPLVRWS